MASSGSDRDAEYALSKLLQIGTVAEYESEFVVLANRVMGISKSLLTSFYISRLKLTLQIDLLRARPTTLGEAFALTWITEARFEDERATTVIAKPNDLNIAVQGCQDGLKPVTTISPTGKKGDLGAITSKGGPPNHMRASEKELDVLKSLSKQKSMFRCHERMLRRQEQQRLAKDAKIQRRIWDPGIKSLQDNTLRASYPFWCAIVHQLEKDMYDSWKSRMELYMLNRQNGRMILESVESGPLIWPSIVENRVTRPKKYSELSATKALQADCDIKETNSFIQGTTTLGKGSSVHHNIYSPSSTIPQLDYPPPVDQQSKFSQQESGLIILVFQKGDDPIDAINHMMSFFTAVVTSRYPTTNNQLRNSSNPKQQATINNGRVTLQPIQGRQSSVAAGTSKTYIPGASGNNSGK
ncbi:hypothetical protein Tco_1571304 [Tanacetum coccineum]